jgi:hypothetical protein
MSSEERGRSSYLDLLITTLMEHEKNLDSIVEKMERMLEELKKTRSLTPPKQEKTVSAKVSAIKEKTREGPSEADSLIYMKVKLDRPIDDVVRIVEALKE